MAGFVHDTMIETNGKDKGNEYDIYKENLPSRGAYCSR
jgi:hypothetical protein